MLAVANDQCPLAGPVRDHKLESHVRWVNGEKRDRAVIVLARRHSAFPFAEVQRRRPGTGCYGDVAEGRGAGLE